MLIKVRSAYLRDEMRYDRWGGLGKILAMAEVLQRHGLALEPRRLERFVNIVFPRTFSSQRKSPPGGLRPVGKVLGEEHDALTRLFREWGIAPRRAEKLSFEELGERYCLDAGIIEEMVRNLHQ